MVLHKIKSSVKTKNFNRPFDSLNQQQYSISLFLFWQDERISGGYENVPTVDIHMKQVSFYRVWEVILK